MEDRMKKDGKILKGLYSGRVNQHPTVITFVFVDAINT